MPNPETPTTVTQYKDRVLRQLHVLQNGVDGFTDQDVDELTEIYKDFLCKIQLQIDKHVKAGNINLNDLLLHGS